MSIVNTLTMKDLFKGFAPKTEQEKRAIWDNCIFTFDTNVLLNLYRYSNNTKNALINTIEKLKPRIWLSHQAVYEFNKNRANVLYTQIEYYDTLVEFFNKANKLLTAHRSHPFLSDELCVKFNEVYQAIQIESKENQDTIRQLVYNDPIYIQVAEIFNGRIGAPYSVEEKPAVEKEGNERFDKRTPPGFSDENKPVNNLGDFILWKQTLDFSKENDKPIILVTNEEKPDWWQIIKGQKIGPRSELVQEMWDFANNDFILITADSFLEQASSYLQETINSTAVQEIKENVYDNYISGSFKIDNNIQTLVKAFKEIDFSNSISSKLKPLTDFATGNKGAKFSIMSKLSNIEIQLSSMQILLGMPRNQEDLAALLEKRDLLIEQKKDLLSELDSLNDSPDD